MTLSQQPFHAVGRAVERRDGMGHVTGTTQYVDDVRYPGMLHLKMVRNPLVHARIRGIDFSAAEVDPPTDGIASAWYRKRMTEVFVRRALEESHAV